MKLVYFVVLLPSARIPMKKFLPLFPLSLVVYPKEKLNLHIFEPRYKQLITECYSQSLTFGIPCFINNKIESYGTEMKLLSLKKVYEDGTMDVETQGLGIFKLLSFENPVKNKLYAGGDTKQVELVDDAASEITEEVISQVKQLYSLLQIDLDLDFKKYQHLSFELAHKIGLSVEQEYQLLTMASEKSRQEFLVVHLKNAIPMIYEMEQTKERIRLNGHFKYLDPLNF
jgi:Lon protease-like protein